MSAESKAIRGEKPASARLFLPVAASAGFAQRITDALHPFVSPNSLRTGRI